jgi:ABC-2 type transport system permease protein
MKTYIALILANLNSSMTHRTSFFLRVFMMFINNIIFFSLWFLLYSNVEEINGWNLKEVMMLYGILYFSFGFNSLLFHGFTRIPELVRTGALDVYLLRPKNVLFQIITSKCEPFGFGDIFTGIIHFLLSGVLISNSNILLFYFILGGMLIELSLSIIFFSIAFWIEHSDDISSKLYESMLSLSMYPDSIYKGVTKIIVFTIFPVVFLGAIPIRLLQEPTILFLIWYHLVAIVLVSLAVTIFYRGLKRYESGNLFSVFGN